MKLSIKVLLFILIFIWSSGIFIEFVIEYIPVSVYLFPWIKKTYSLVCHQESYKLIELNGLHTMVCARCSGIYIGALLSSFIALFISLKERLGIHILLIAMIPMVLDVIFYTAGLYSYSKSAAFITGFLLGSAGFFYLYYGLENIYYELKTNRK
ncbi:DUF2085 domain-containing protein [Bacteroidota bacterium]